MMMLMMLMIVMMMIVKIFQIASHLSRHNSYDPVMMMNILIRFS